MTNSNIKVFNTTGPCIPSKHYMLPVLPRVPEVDEMIRGEYYFIIHAPRQSGKSTYLDIQTDKINLEGRFYAINCSLMATRGIEDQSIAMSTVVAQINQSMYSSTVEFIKNKAFSYNLMPGMDEPSLKVRTILNRLCEDLDKQLIVFFDEADCLSGVGLITFLAQIRDAYHIRHKIGNKFPRSMALVGMRDIRDYLFVARSGGPSTGVASPFNIKRKALTLANFTQEEIKILYHQHTVASGQIFEDESIKRAWYWSEGQPWLVNALALEAVDEILANDYLKPVTGDLMDQAAERLIKRRDTHIDSLLERLKEPRVRRVMQPVILGMPRLPDTVTDDDKQYVIDLGLLKLDRSKLKPANPIYAEVILRTLSQRYQDELPDELENKWMDGHTLDMTSLLKEFQIFWQENSEMMGNPYNYDETVSHLVCFAYLQRVLNGGVDTLSREYALGKKRVDINAKYMGRSYPVELKLKGDEKFQDLIRRDALVQMQGYMNTCGAKEGWLVIFDRDSTKPWEEKITWETIDFEGLTIHIVGC